MSLHQLRLSSIFAIRIRHIFRIANLYNANHHHYHCHNIGANYYWNHWHVMKCDIWHIQVYTDKVKTEMCQEIFTSTWVRTSMNPQLWLDDQHNALSTPSHSELSALQQAVSSAHRQEMSFNLWHIHTESI